jgi:hypothetical protein
MEALEEIREDYVRIKEAHEEDERKKKDDDGGKKPTTELQPAQLVQRKLQLALLAVEDPQKLSMAVGRLYTAWLAVVATLRIQFAKTVTLGISIADMLDGPAMRYGLPIIAHLVPPEYHRWLPVAIRTLAKAVAVAFAWYLSVLISAAQSAMRGGLMCSRALLRIANKHDVVEVNEDDSYLDEIVGFLLAAAGLYTQWMWGFEAPFPLNIVLLPFSAIEWYIRWTVTSVSSYPPP